MVRPPPEIRPVSSEPLAGPSPSPLSSSFLYGDDIWSGEGLPHTDESLNADWYTGIDGLDENAAASDSSSSVSETSDGTLDA